MPKEFAGLLLTHALKGSVIPAVMPKAILCGCFGIAISILSAWKWQLAWPILGNVIPSIVLGLLLVFRTNTAYERFWEGRKAWGTLINTTRNLTRRIWVFIAEKDDEDRAHKKEVLHLIVAFAIAMKQHLRHEPCQAELQHWISDRHIAEFDGTPNLPLDEICNTLRQNVEHLVTLTPTAYATLATETGDRLWIDPL